MSPWTSGLLSAHKEAFYVEACCGGKKRYQDLRQCASQTMVHIDVFKSCLKQLGRWDPEITPEKEVDQMIQAARTRTTSWK